MKVLKIKPFTHKLIQSVVSPEMNEVNFKILDIILNKYIDFSNLETKRDVLCQTVLNLLYNFIS